MKFLLLSTIVAVSIGLSAIAVSAGSQTEVEVEMEEEEEPEFGLMFVAPGVETTYFSCVGCHSERIIIQQGLTRDGWAEMLDWMVDEQGMGELDEIDTTEILDYLSAHYNTDRPNFPRN